MHHRRLKNKPITNVYTIELFKENTHMHVHCRLPWWQRFSLAREKWWEKKNPWRYRVTILLSMTQCNFRTRLGPISSLDILIRRAPFWPADIHTVHAREWRERLKPVTQPVWLVQTPGRLIAHTQQDIDTISSEVFLFSPFFAYQKKTSVIRVTVGEKTKPFLYTHTHQTSIGNGTFTSSIWDQFARVCFKDNQNCVSPLRRTQFELFKTHKCKSLPYWMSKRFHYLSIIYWKNTLL